MQESGLVRGGTLVAGRGAAEVAIQSAVDMLGSLRAEPQTPEVLFLAATDPANPYGTSLSWPHKEMGESGDAESASTVEANSASSLSRPSMSRTRRAGVILSNGTLAAFLR